MKVSLKKYDFSGLKDCFHLNHCLKKLKKTVSTSRNKIWSLSNSNNGFKENMNERISFSLNRKSVATGLNKDSFKTCFHEMEKRLPFRGNMLANWN